MIRGILLDQGGEEPVSAASENRLKITETKIDQRRRRSKPRAPIIPSNETDGSGIDAIT